jgi:hypothetical protein
MKHIHEKIEAGKANCFRRDDQGVVWFNNHVVVPKNDEICQQILDEAHLSRYSIHPRSTKMYHDLKQHYWWTKMKIEIARYVARCDTCRRVKAIHMKAAGPLQSLPIPTWKWEDKSMDFIVGLPRTAKGYDSIWVIVDRLTKIAHFLPVKTDVTPGFRRQTECEPCTCQDQLFHVHSSYIIWTSSHSAQNSINKGNSRLHHTSETSI